MVIAPAIGIACLQVLGWLCFVVTCLSVAVVLKQSFAPNDGLQVGTMLTMAGVFGLGGLACLWAARLLRRTARGE